MLTHPTPPQPARTLGDLPDVPGFVRAGIPAGKIVDALAAQLALNAALRVLQQTDGNLSALLRERPSPVVAKWREDVRTAIRIAVDAGAAA
ncbi:hypothetical protein [Synechococcus phage Ssp-JY42]|nr:hypothetical protein [Synechococcus phage Yong-M4-211]